MCQFRSHLTFGDHLADYLATGRVKVHPDLLSFEEHSVEFTDRTVVEGVDAVRLRAFGLYRAIQRGLFLKTWAV